MQEHWNDQQPIYRQLRDRVAAQILNGHFKEGEAIPSVRQVSSESKLNHVTVSKAYQELVDEGVLEMKRGRGMFVVTGAREQLKQAERHKFIEEELPQLVSRMDLLNISPDDLIQLLQEQQ